MWGRMILQIVIRVCLVVVLVWQVSVHWTAAMAAGITDHVWTMGEFLLFRISPWRQEATAA